MVNKVLFQGLFSICLLAAGLNVSAEELNAQTEEDQKVYRKFHPDGVVEFSDQPSKGSEQLEVEELPTYKFSPAAPAAPAAKLTPQSKQQTSTKPAPTTNPYKSLTINSPTSGESIRANNGDIDVKFSLAPGLQFYKGHKFEYLLDGKSILKTDRPQTLRNIDRGTHTVLIKVLDQNDRPLIQSNSVSFEVKRFIKPKPSTSNTSPSPDEPDFDAEYET